MNNAALDTFEQTNYLNEGYPEVLDSVRPAFAQLLQDLQALPDTASETKRLQAFAKAFDAINAFEDDIETVERETILDTIYRIGIIVGLSAESEFAEEYRGDW